jgi:hypothetical protein
MQNSSKRETRRGLLLTLLILGMMTALIVVPSQFQSKAVGGAGLIQRTTSEDPSLPNYDIRLEKGEEIESFLASSRQSIAKDASSVADVRDAFVRGENSLRTRVPDVKFEYNADIRIPEVITPDVWKDNGQLLSGPSQAKRSDILRNFVRENNELIGVNDEQANLLRVAADYTNPNGYMSFAHLEQLVGDVPVFRGEVKAGFTKDGRMIRVINNLAPGLDYDSLSTNFGDPRTAAIKAYGYINDEPKGDLTANDAASTDLRTVFGTGDWATTAQKMYFPTEPGVAVPSWMVTIWRTVDAYMVIVDAQTGTLLWRKNATNDQTQSATYQIYRNSNSFIGSHDNPAPLSPYLPAPIVAPINAQGALLTRTNVTLIGNEAPFAFNNNGWITDGANITDGNALEAGIDRDGTNGVDAPQTGAPNRTFDSTWNPPPGNPAPGDEPVTAQAQRGAVIQMFYVMNRYHDELYRVGFTEPARNFQHDNFGRGGLGNDRISAEGQDSGGFNNANFSIVADGTRGRMQMYLWNGPTPDKDGTTDAEVIIHEVTHGTSQRLHGNATGLSQNMAGGMGEGWGDWYAYTMLAEPSDPIDGVYTTGGYATHLLGGMTSNYYHGIRRFPRAPITYTGGPNNKPHNPFTFKHLNGNCDTTLGTTAMAVDSAFPRNPSVSTSSGAQACNQVHNAGEIWSSALWEVRNRMVARLGFTAGTTRVLQVVTDGMKLSPLNPTFLQARDAIITAAAALPIAPEAAADVFDVREGFRVRGMGFSASIQNANPGGTSNATQVTEAFDVPNAIIVDPITMSDSTGDNDGFAEPGEPVLISVPITNNSGSGSIANVNGAITGGGNASYGTINDGQTVVRQIPYTVPSDAVCGSTHNITITGSSSLGALNPRQHSFVLGAPVGGAPVSFTGGAIANPGTGTTGNANPYPSTINVAGLSGNKVIVFELTDLNTTYPGDMDWLLVSPGGQKFLVMSDALSSFTTQTNADVVFRDDAAAIIPATGSNNLNGSWRPTNHDTTTDAFTAPAPAAPYDNPAPAGAATLASAFGTNSANWNGTWSLYGRDDVSGDIATIAGWKLTFESNEFVCNYTPGGAERSRADFDGDGRTDVSVFRPSEGNWYLNRSTAGFGVIKWGLNGDILVPGDYDNDNKTDTAVFRPNADPAQVDFWVLNSNGNTVTGISWGLAGDIPVIGDYDDDGRSDIAVFRPSNNTWYIHHSGGGITVAVFGQAGDVPVAGDFNGDTIADRTVYRSGTWISQLSGGGSLNIAHGTAGDILVPGDYDDDNIDDIAVFRPSTGQWIVRQSTNTTVVSTAWGAAGDVPVPGDYDGDGRDDFAIYRNGTWWINRSTSGILVTNFGLGSDTPIPDAYLP